MRAHAKPVVGYSDVTSLLLALYARSGLVGFHGPVGVSTWEGDTPRAFLDVLVEGKTLALQGETRSDRLRGDTIRGGTAEGPLAGGNLSVLAATAGTDYAPDLGGHVVFFEEIGEDSYRIDRLLTQVRQAGLVADPAGLVFGQCSRCSSGGSAWSAERVIQDQLAAYDRPAWLGAPIGHVAPVYPLPIGIPTRIDADERRMETLEPAVAV
jgi:muramoyltetrapeptide carboxypeptidase